MDNLITSTNNKLKELIDNLAKIKKDYETELENNTNKISEEKEKVESYKKEFNSAKEKIDKMNNDIEGFEKEYQNLVDKFKDDELANILIAANKEITLKIDERKKTILEMKKSMNENVIKAQKIKIKLVKLSKDKKTLEDTLENINNAYNYYNEALNEVIENSTNSNKIKETKKLDEPEIELNEKIEIEDYTVENDKNNAEYENDDNLFENNEINDNLFNNEDNKSLDDIVNKLNEENTIDDFKIENIDDTNNDINNAELENILNFDDSLEEQ